MPKKSRDTSKEPDEIGKAHPTSTGESPEVAEATAAVDGGETESDQHAGFGRDEKLQKSKARSKPNPKS